MTWRRVVVVVVGLVVAVAHMATFLGLSAVAVVAGQVGRSTPGCDALLTVLQFPFFPLWVAIPAAWVGPVMRLLGPWVVYGALIGNGLIWGATFAWATHRLLKVRTSN
jgi:hypothetical protein